ncbi:MAG: TonB C-terminal domain-containing protein [Deltaproteobacteria bacterium]|nr:TonB C-terminal domain-containing protein [Deltaproteobacteria bacterium]
MAVEDGEVPEAELAALQTVLRPCPPSTQEWGARVSDGALRRLGAIVADDLPPAEGVESCLRAGLEAKPPTTATMLRLHHVDPELDSWRAQLQGLLNRVVGPQRGASCVMVTLRLGKDDVPAGPKLTRSSGDPTLDDAVMRALNAWKEPLPAPSRGRAPADRRQRGHPLRHGHDGPLIWARQPRVFTKWNDVMNRPSADKSGGRAGVRCPGVEAKGRAAPGPAARGGRRWTHPNPAPTSVTPPAPPPRPAPGRDPREGGGAGGGRGGGSIPGRPSRAPADNAAPGGSTRRGPVVVFTGGLTRGRGPRQRRGRDRAAPPGPAQVPEGRPGLRPSPRPPPPPPAVSAPRRPHHAWAT